MKTIGLPLVPAPGTGFAFLAILEFWDRRAWLWGEGWTKFVNEVHTPGPDDPAIQFISDPSDATQRTHCKKSNP
jgi:hypothetical protein